MRNKVVGALSWCAILAGVFGSENAFPQHPVESLQPGHWYQAPNTKLSSVDPCPEKNCSYSGNEGQRGVMDDWNGGAFATNYGAMGSLLVFGGGHDGYYGNEVYAFDVATLKWSRVTEPVKNPDCNYTEGELQDGSPCAPHTYDYVEYHPGTNSFVKLGSASDHDRGGLGSPRVHLLNLDTKQWRRGARKPTFPGVNGEGGYGMTGASSAYDPNRDVFWVLPAYNSRFAKYDPNANNGAGEWTEYGRINVDIDGVAAIDPIRDLYVLIEARLTQSVIVIDLKNPSAGPVTVNVTGDRSFLQNKGNGFEWDPVSKAFVGWMGGTSVYKLTPPESNWKTGAWQLTKINAAASNTVTPTTPNMNDTYSRWRYVPALNAFVVVNRTTDNVFFYKLSANVPQPTISLSANPTTVSAQGTTQVTWSTTNATSCTGTSNPSVSSWNGTRETSGSNVAIGPLSATTTLTLTCTNDQGGTANRSVTVNVQSNTPAPTVSFSANPSSIPSGGSTTLSWSSSNATSCNGTGGGSSGWAGSKATQGSQNLGPLSANTTFTLSCTGGGGTTTRSATVTVTASEPPPPPPPPEPTLEFSASPTTVNAQGSTQLTWTSTNATSCTASGGWSGSKATSGNQTISSISSTTTYTLACSGQGGQVSRSVTVTVQAAQPQDPPPQNPPPPQTPPVEEAKDSEGGGGSLGAFSALLLLALLLARVGTRYRAPSAARSPLKFLGGLLGLVAFTSAQAQVSNWEARSTAPGVVLAVKFTQQVVNEGKFANGNNPTLLANVTFDPQGGVDGKGGLKINVPSSVGADPGAWRIAFPNFWGSGVNRTEFYVQFRVRFSSGRLSCNSGDGFKIANISSYDRSLTAFEVVPWNSWNSGNLMAYYGGSPPFLPNPSPAFKMPENEWFTIYLQIRAAKYDGSDPNNKFIMKAARAGATQWTTLYNLTGGNWYGSDGSAPSGFDGLWFTPYSTNREPNKCPSSSQEYDELIVSTQPIALPDAPTVQTPTVNLSANPTTVSSQGTTQVTWSSTNATSCTASSNPSVSSWNGTRETSGTNVPVGPLSANTTLTLQCTNDSGGTASRSVTVNVQSNTPAPTVSFSASPSSIPSGGSTTLSWSSSNATSCNGTGGSSGWAGSKSTTGSQNVGPLSANTTFNLSCTGGGGTTSRSVQVTVTANEPPPPPPEPTLEFSASPTTVSAQGSTQLNWKSTNATSCTASGGWSGSKSTSGTQTINPTSTTTYTLACSGQGGQVSRSVTVTVQAAQPQDPPPQTPPVSEARDSEGGGGSLDELSALLLLGVLAATLRGRRRRIAALH